MESDITEELHTPGERCYINNFRGTVRYVGEVPPTEGTWYGVEWDTARGKNDGMIHGHRYFQCKESHGSFVRPHKISFGVDAITGFRKHYGNGKLGFDDKGIVLNEKTSRETVIEMIGFDKLAMKQSDYENLRQADLAGANISHVVHHGLEHISPSLKSLNLRDNLLSSLKEIYKMAGSLKKLQLLNISENQITDWNTGDVERSTAFQQLTSIYVNKMNLKWNQLIVVLKMAPSVKEIHACINEIRDVRYDPSLEGIEVLNLQGNLITDWSSVWTLSKLTKLQKLILNSNQLTKAEIPPDEADVPFKSLKSLSLSDNLINEWHSINILNDLPSVTEFRFRDNPICQGKTGFELRQELIARLENVKILNGSEVAERERKTAEMAYIKTYSTNYYKARREDTISNFNIAHPKYQKLANLHGLPDEQVNTTKSLKDNLINLEIKCPDCSSKPVTEKKVPSTMTLQQLKGVLQRLYKIPTSKQKISYFDTKNSREIHLEDNMKQLCFYSIASGDTVLLRW